MVLIFSRDFFQAPRPMGGATRVHKHNFSIKVVSIHAPHAGRDMLCKGELEIQHEFQSTRPMRGATNGVVLNAEDKEFQSTRPMRGATCLPAVRTFLLSSFNPRAPCGARRCALRGSLLGGGFQSTRPMRGATADPRPAHQLTDVSIHAPHAGRDTATGGNVETMAVSIHAPHAGRDTC